MDPVIEPGKYAFVLFWVFLIPAAFAVFLMELSFQDDWRFNYEDAGGMLLLICQVIVEIVYFLQFNFVSKAQSKGLWRFTFAINIINSLIFMSLTIASHTVLPGLLALTFGGIGYFNYKVLKAIS